MKYHLSPKNKKEIILPPQLDDYTLKECIGFGSFGEVYKIYDEKKQKDYAIKVFFIKIKLIFSIR